MGTVKDATGTVIPQAKVSVTDVDRGNTFSTTTNPSGDYVASPLRIGHYSVKIEREGFKTTVAGPIELQVQEHAEVNVTLEVGQMVQTVEVHGSSPLLETQTSELGQVVSTRRMVDLPLNGRNFAQLALLSAGVAPTEPGARNEGSYGFSSNGGRSYQNNFLLDGVDNNSNLTDLLNGTSYVVQPSVDALQEFKVQTNAYSAEFGRGNGAILNATIKSGTNSFHGVGYEFLRNDHLDARNFFEDQRGAYQQNQFGGNIGGPIRLGNAYDGRNRSFFFVNYEGLRVRQGKPLTATVPTADWRAGNFSDVLDLTSPTGTLAGAIRSTSAPPPTWAATTRAAAASSAPIPSGSTAMPIRTSGSGWFSVRCTTCPSGGASDSAEDSTGPPMCCSVGGACPVSPRFRPVAGTPSAAGKTSLTPTDQTGPT